MNNVISRPDILNFADGARPLEFRQAGPVTMAAENFRVGDDQEILREKPGAKGADEKFHSICPMRAEVLFEEFLKSLAFSGVMAEENDLLTAGPGLPRFGRR